MSAFFDAQKGQNSARARLDKARELHDSIPGSLLAGQVDNPANSQAHVRTTGPEIWQDTDGRVDVFVAGAGFVPKVLDTSVYDEILNATEAQSYSRTTA